jgi:ABC-2 type transport system permease protein
VNARRVVAILMKDLRDAFRDGRVLVLLLLPIGMAIFYNATVEDEDELPRERVAIADPQAVGLADQLQRSAGRSVELVVTEADGAVEVRRLVGDEKVEFGAVVTGDDRVDVVVPDDADPTTQAVVGLVSDAATRASGREPPTEVRIQPVAATNEKPADVIGARPVTVLIAIVLLATFVAMMVVPIQTAEELETGTFGALRLAATGPEILAAKAAAGCLYSAVGVILTVLLTQLELDRPVLFVAAAVGLVVSMVGFGLLLGLLVANANAINTYGGFALIPLVGLAVAVFFVDESGTFSTVLDALPFSQATKLMGDALSAEQPFDAGAVAWIVVAAWAVVGYAALARFATRREL